MYENLLHIIGVFSKAMRCKIFIQKSFMETQSFRTEVPNLQDLMSDDLRWG